MNILKRELESILDRMNTTLTILTQTYELALRNEPIGLEAIAYHIGPVMRDIRMIENLLSKQPQRYEVQTYTECDGWTNTWKLEVDGVLILEYFDSESAAQEAIDLFLHDIANEIATGEREPDNGFSPEDLRIAHVMED